MNTELPELQFQYSDYDVPQFVIGDYLLFRTCLACPEQYDVTDLKYNQRGYLRLRHGRFTVTVPDVGGKTIYASYPLGSDGIFGEEQLRLDELTRAVQAIDNYFNLQQLEFDFDAS